MYNYSERLYSSNLKLCPCSFSSAFDSLSSALIVFLTNQPAQPRPLSTKPCPVSTQLHPLPLQL